MMNLVLIGLSGSGKSTFGARLAKKLRMPLLDTDDMIVAAERRSIPDIFAASGEPYFRDLESAAARKAASASGAVISTGGGMVLREENMAALAENGFIVFIERHPSLIFKCTTQADRPLVKADKSRLLALHDARIALYRRHAQYTLFNDRTMNRRLGRGVLRIARAFRRACAAQAGPQNPGKGKRP